MGINILRIILPSNQPSKNVRELYRLYRETFPVAPVSQALIIIFTTRTPSALLHSTPSCFVCVCNSIQTHLHHSETASHDGLCTCRNVSFMAVHTGRVLYVLRSFLNGIGENAQIEDRLRIVNSEGYYDRDNWTISCSKMC